MRAYAYDNLPGDQREEHDSGSSFSHDELEKLGITYRSIPIDSEDKWKDAIDAFAKERGYKNRDQITVTREGLGESYEAKIKQFFDEHLHEDEEIRYILGGSGYFDVRGFGGKVNDQWIRIAMQPGDLIVLPAGIYHRFTVDSNNTITAMRLFQDEPKWTPYSRSEGETDKREARSLGSAVPLVFRSEQSAHAACFYSHPPAPAIAHRRKMCFTDHQIDKAPPTMLNFVIMLLPDEQVDSFKSAFGDAWDQPPVRLSLGPVPQTVATEYVATDPTDRYLTVSPRAELGLNEKNRLVHAVHLAAQVVGSGMLPVRNMGGFKGVATQP